MASNIQVGIGQFIDLVGNWWRGVNTDIELMWTNVALMSTRADVVRHGLLTSGMTLAYTRGKQGLYNAWTSVQDIWVHRSVWQARGPIVKIPSRVWRRVQKCMVGRFLDFTNRRMTRLTWWRVWSKEDLCVRNPKWHVKNWQRLIKVMCGDVCGGERTLGFCVFLAGGQGGEWSD